MDKMLEIKSVKLDRLSIGEYSQFIKRLIHLVNNATIEKISLDEKLFEQIKKNADLLIEIIGQSYISQETKKLSEIDKERNALIGYLLSTIKLEKKGIEKEKIESATILLDVCKNYNKLQTLPMRTKAQFINSMINDLDKPQNTSHINTLGLSKTITLLHDKNQEYEKLSAGRSENQLANTFVSFKQIKVETNELYKTLVKYAFATYLLNNSPECTNFLNLLNKLIEDTNNANKQRLGQSSQK
ncbi:MAG: DUF6261 family protein [Capnocytophaga sp.]|nr:DUF6261 family protein [Capnocytophaga sp.]